jgi:hypothetical protein
VKTDLLEENVKKANSLEDSVHAEIPMETEETVKKRSSNRGQVVKTRSKEGTAKAVASKAKNGETESMSKGKFFTIQPYND